MKHLLNNNIKVGDLVWIHKPTPPKGQVVPEINLKPELAIYLGQKTFDETYACSMVHFVNWDSSLPQPRPVQSNLLEKVQPKEKIE